ncbi:MAG TPA: sensor histidine kinase [Burkholderiaceae bacterium]|nr:sensor histidine kinase [Burkholderiaceae bacterium]
MRPGQLAGVVARSHARRSTDRAVDVRVPLALLALLGLLPMMLIAIGLVQMQWHARQQEIRRDVGQSTQLLARVVDAEIRASVRQLERIADVPTLQAPRLEAFHEYLQRLVAQRAEWANLLLVDPQGRRLLDAERPFGEVPPVREPIPFEAVLRTGAPVLSGPYRSVATGAPAVSVSVPVRRDGEIRWVLNARLSPRYLSEAVRGALPEDESLGAVLDESGRLVARSRDHERWFGERVTPTTLRLFEGAPSGVGEIQALDGRPMLAGWERLPGGWIVQYAVPRERHEGPLYGTLGITALAGLLLLALGVGSSLWLARRLSEAVALAAADAASLAEARPVPRRGSTIRQLRTLFSALHEAGERLGTAARERAEAHERLEEALRHRDAALEESREALRRRDEFLAMLSHELRNPLAPITTGCTLLDRNPAVTGTSRRIVEMLCRQSRQLTRLVDDLLDLSRLAAGKIRLQPRPFDLAELVDQAVVAARTYADAHGQRIEAQRPLRADGTPEPVLVTADPARVRQVVDNLLSNAVKFGRRGTTIRVELDVEPGDEPAAGHRPDGGAGDDGAPAPVELEVVPLADPGAARARLRVTDLGEGLEAASLDRIFLPFAQIDPGIARSRGGLGLGLPLVRRLVQLHGGSVSVRSPGLERGATFTVRLPFSGPAAAGIAADSSVDFSTLER